MNKNGQIGTQIGSLILLAIALIVGAILIQASAQNVGNATNTVNIVNQSIGSTVVNGTTYYLTNVKSLSSVVVLNETNNVAIGSGNYTLTNNVVYNGQEAVSIVPATAAAYKSNWKISGVGQPLTYINDGAGRSIAGFIVLLMCLALVVIAATWATKAYSSD
jgi:hypothetical protein